MSHIERSIVIGRAPEDVFAFVHDTSNDTRWQPTLVESEHLTEGPFRVGTKIREVRRFLGIRFELVLEVTEYEPNARSAIQMVSGPVPGKGSYVIEPADGGTRFTVTGDVDSRGFFKVAEPIFARMAGRELESNLGHLKDILESAEAA